MRALLISLTILVSVPTIGHAGEDARPSYARAVGMKALHGIGNVLYSPVDLATTTWTMLRGSPNPSWWTTALDWGVILGTGNTVYRAGKGVLMLATAPVVLDPAADRSFSFAPATTWPIDLAEQERERTVLVEAFAHPERLPAQAELSAWARILGVKTSAFSRPLASYELRYQLSKDGRSVILHRSDLADYVSTLQ